MHRADNPGGVASLMQDKWRHPRVALGLFHQALVVRAALSRTGARDSPSRSANSAFLTELPGAMSSRTMASRMASYAMSRSNIRRTGCTLIC